MENQNDNILKIYAGKRAWYELGLSSVFYMVPIYILLMTAYYLFISDFNEALLSFFDFLYLGLPGLASALAFSMTKNLEINTDKNTIISYYCVGPFTKKVQTRTMEFEYISVFLNQAGDFETNLWYKGNKFYGMFAFYEKDEAFEFGKMLSDKLGIDLLDATERGNNKWVEKETI